MCYYACAVHQTSFFIYTDFHSKILFDAVLPQSMQIETSDQKTVHTERAVVPQVTAKVVQPNPTGPPKVEVSIVGKGKSSYCSSIILIR